jgi:hypothetical protein
MPTLAGRRTELRAGESSKAVTLFAALYDWKRNESKYLKTEGK